MEHNTHIAEAFDLVGGVSAVARLFGITAWAASKWETKGVPPNRVIDLAKATGWRKTPHQLSPDIYPNATDGMPPRRRAPRAHAQQVAAHA